MLYRHRWGLDGCASNAQ